MKNKTLILTLLVCLPAWGSDCADRQAISQIAYERMVQAQQQKAQLRSEIPQLDQDLERAGVALPGYNDSVAICKISDQKVKSDRETLSLAIDIVNDVLIFDRTLRERLLQIIKNGSDAPDWNLSSLLKNYAEQYRPRADQRAQILYIAKALDLLMEKDQNWRVEERNWLEKVKADNLGLEELAEKFQLLFEDKAFNDRNLLASCERSTEQAALLKQQIENALKRKAEIEVEMGRQDEAYAQAERLRDANQPCTYSLPSRHVL